MLFSSVPRIQLSQDSTEGASPREHSSTDIQKTVEKFQSPQPNPMFANFITGDMREYRQEGTLTHDAHGQPTVFLNSSINIFSADAHSTLKSNWLLEVNKDPFLTQNFIRSAAKVLPPEEILALGRYGASAIYCDRTQSRIIPERGSIGLTFQIVKAQICLLEGRSWHHDLPGEMQPLKVHSGQAVIPIVGNLHVCDRALTEDQLRQLGIVPLGVPPSANNGADNQDPISAELPFVASGGRSILLPMAGCLFLTETPEGGRRVIYDLQELEVLIQSRKVEMHPIVACQYLGVGVRRYIYHVAEKSTEGQVSLKDGDLVVIPQDVSDQKDFAIIQRSEYAGQSGIFLDQKHQHLSECPTGGVTNAPLSYERDQLFLAHGARMSGIVVNYTELLKKDQLKKVVPDALLPDFETLYVAQRVILDDTLRLSSLIQDRSVPLKERCVYQVITRFEKDYSIAARDAYLSQLCENVGVNIGVCLKLRMIMKQGERTSDNLSSYGRLLDTENLFPISNRFQVLPLFRQWFIDIGSVLNALDVSQSSFLKSAQFRSLVGGFLEPRFVAQLREELHRVEPILKPREALGTAALIAAWIWVEQSLKHDGKDLSSQDLIERAVRYKTMRILLPPEIVHDDQLIKRWARKGVPDQTNVTSIFKGMGFSYSRADIMSALRRAYITAALDQHAPSVRRRPRDAEQIDLVREVKR